MGYLESKTSLYVYWLGGKAVKYLFAYLELIFGAMIIYAAIKAPYPVNILGWALSPVAFVLAFVMVTNK